MPNPKYGNNSEDKGLSTRERVIQCAAELFANQGYAATGVAQIAKTSATHPNSIYWAFESKEGLLLAVLESLSDEFFAKGVVRTGWDLETSMRSVFERFAQTPEFLRLLLMLVLERRDGDPRVIQTAHDVYRRGIVQLMDFFDPFVALDDEHARLDVCEQLANLTLTLINGMAATQQIESRNIDMKSALDSLTLAVCSTLDTLVRQTKQRT